MPPDAHYTSAGSSAPTLPDVPNALLTPPTPPTDPQCLLMPLYPCCP